MTDKLNEPQQSQGATPVVQQRGVMPLLHGKPMMTMWVIIAAINVANQNICGAYNALACVWFVYAYESAYRMRQRHNARADLPPR